MNHEVMSSDRRAVMWNPWNKVVQAHDDGTISHALTNMVRARLGLPTPWTPQHADADVRSPAVFNGNPY